MPTPLETYLKEVMSGPTLFAIDGGRLAIGTDKVGYSPLQEGVEWICHVSARARDLDPEWLLVPLCFSYDLVQNGGQWSEPRNLNWIKTVTTGRDPPTLCHVFHAKAAETLASPDGSCTPERFRREYRGNRNTTFKEIELILAAGYTTTTTVGRPGHAILWRT